MSLLGQINIVNSVVGGHVRSIGHAPGYVKGLTYDRLHQQFERPAHALGNRYRNPVARVYDRIVGALRGMAIPIRGIENTFRRIEISIRLKPSPQ